ncbi:hypothetical protein CPB84DRAFT_1692844 [Gymnopilus junonius]|uniref:DUF6593 domain-containing protein n=1 Tax=Gymnopilus junonius TaxID=109634 RepID=A0A9P5N6Y2_GYMJU|nr:hypothetical protein CPB84DRAFT_1692844 [Gymnopilus junonius]
MDLYLIPNDPEDTVLVSANGVVHYQVQTIKFKKKSNITVISRPSGSEDSVVAEIEWKHSDSTAIIRSPLFSGDGQRVGTKGIGVPVFKYLYKRHRYGRARYFVGEDAQEYRWKMMRNIGCVLTPCDSGFEIASSKDMFITDGPFAGERKRVLRIQPCALDIDLIVLTFIIMERLRRKQDGDDVVEGACDEDPQGDGGGSGDDADTGAGSLGVDGEL